MVQYTTRTILRFFIFLTVFLAVMSVSFLVEAHDMPGVSASVPVVSTDTLDMDDDVVFVDSADGLASWYGRAFHGRRTASGRRYDMHDFTAAHRTLPFGSLARVTNPATGRSRFVEITDRGPFIRRRVIDLSYAAARDLNITVTPVTVEAVTPAALCDTLGDSLCAVISADQRMQLLPLTVLEEFRAVDDYSTAAAATDDRRSVVILPSPTGTGLSYGIAAITIAAPAGRRSLPVLADGND